MAFMMLSYRAWQLETLRTEPATPHGKLVPEIYFRHVEKIILQLVKYTIQWIVLIVVKYSFIIYTKVKKWIVNNWPKVYNIFKSKPQEANPVKYTFAQRAKLELKAKIRHTKEKVRREQEEKITSIDKQF